MKKIAFATHAFLIGGKEYEAIGDLLVETLGAANRDFYMVRHSADGERPSRVEHYTGRAKRSTKRLNVISKPGLLRYTSEIVATVAYFTFRQKADIFIGLDPLNALAGILLKKLRRVHNSIFYTPDYSPQRFSGSILNKLYHAIDRYCVRQADEVWSVSPRIKQVRRDMGLPEARNILVPNVPPATYNHLRNNKHDKYVLISSGVVDKQLDNEGVIRAVAELAPAHPKLRLVIIGNGPDEDRLKSLIKELNLTDRVELTGRLPLSETYARYSTSGIGLALYTGKWGFNIYGDSSKCRQCFYLGMPVISTDSHATVPEIRAAKAGVIVTQDVAAYVAAITEILAHYHTYAKAASKLGARYDDIHKKQIMRLVNEPAPQEQL